MAEHGGANVFPIHAIECLCERRFIEFLSGSIEYEICLVTDTFEVFVEDSFEFFGVRYPLLSVSLSGFVVIPYELSRFLVNPIICVFVFWFEFEDRKSTRLNSSHRL